MSKIQTINPFELLGINEKSTLKEAKKSYYNLALIVHPDCGGHEESMKVLSNAYSFVEEQIKNKRDVSKNIGKELELEFKEYCNGLNSLIPKLGDLYDLAEMQENIREMDSRNYEAYNKKFNKQFEQEQEEEREEKYDFDFIDNPFKQDGYGYLMDKTENDYDTDEEFIVPTRVEFQGDIAVYKEPNILPDTYGQELRFDIEKVEDYSNYDGNMFDYKKAHSVLENEPKNIKSEMDKPIKNLNAMIKKLELEREKLKQEKFQIDLKFNRL